MTMCPATGLLSHVIGPVGLLMPMYRARPGFGDPSPV